MDRIELIPKDVRGGGNITQSHDSMVTDEQVSVYRSTLTRSGGVSDSFYLPYYRVVRKAGVNLLWNPPRVTDDSSVTVSVNFVYDSNNLPVVSSEVILDLRDSDNEVLWTGSGTISDGAVSFSIDILDDFPSVCFWNVNVSHSNYGHVHDSRRMVIGSVTNFDAFATEDIIQTGETSYLVGTVTGLSSEGNVFGVPGRTVNYYHVFTPGLRVSAPKVIQSGDNIDIKAQLIDSVDGSLVREAEHTVNFYWDDAPVPVPTRLYVDFDKTILSYADGDSAYVVVRVYDQLGDAMPNQSVSVSRSDGVSWTVETDSEGQGSFSYVSQGVGDVSFTFECMNLQETCSIEDCLKYYENELSRTSSSSSYVFTPLFNDFTFRSDSFIAEFDIKTDSNGVGVSISSTNDTNKFLWLANQVISGTPSKVVYYKDSNNSETGVTYNAMSNNTYHHIKLEYVNSELKVYDTNGLLGTITGLSHYNGDTRSIYFGEWIPNHNVYAKNIKIKPL